MRQLVVTEVYWAGLMGWYADCRRSSLAHACGVGCLGFIRLESLRQADLTAYMAGQLKSIAGVNSALMPDHSI